MAMHYHPALFAKEFSESPLIRDDMLIGRHGENAATEQLDLLTGYKRRVLVNDEVKLHSRAVNVAVIVHNNRFKASADHLAHNMGDTYGLKHMPQLPCAVSTQPTVCTISLASVVTPHFLT